MGIFSRRPEEATRTVEGVIARVGVIRHMEDGVSYGIHLMGVKGMFVVSDRIGKPKHQNVWTMNPHITMASRGDRVRFGVKPSEPGIIVDFFENETYATDVG